MQYEGYKSGTHEFRSLKSGVHVAMSQTDDGGQHIEYFIANNNSQTHYSKVILSSPDTKSDINTNSSTIYII